MTRVLVTGGAGFIGSAVCRHLVRDDDSFVVNLDKLTYAGNLASLRAIENRPNHRFVQGDIADSRTVSALLDEHRIEAVLHLAAESHVDRSIDGPDVFVQTNVAGTCALLAAATDHWRALDPERRRGFRFHHVSTDEVYGDLPLDGGAFTEQTPYNPSSPYAASKAASDHFVRAWHRTYGLPVVLTNCSNNYGPFHHPEKFIPLMILNALEGRDLPVYGRGENVRDWLFVDDHAHALETVLRHGTPGATYNIGGRAERANIDVVHAICALLDRLAPRVDGGRHVDRIRFVDDRPGHDRRYAVNTTRIESELGWRPRETFETGLEKTVRWYLDNAWWWTPLRRRDRGVRRGTG